jgi:hypothetical protein
MRARTRVYLDKNHQYRGCSTDPVTGMIIQAISSKPPVEKQSSGSGVVGVVVGIVAVVLGLIFFFKIVLPVMIIGFVLKCIASASRSQRPYRRRRRYW